MDLREHLTDPTHRPGDRRASPPIVKYTDIHYRHTVTRTGAADRGFGWRLLVCFVFCLFFFALRGVDWVGCTRVRGAAGAAGSLRGVGAAGRGVLEAQAFTYKWASKQYTVGSNIPYRRDLD